MKEEAAGSSIRHGYNELQSERVCCLVTIVSTILTWITPKMRLEAEREHLLKRISSLQAAQSEHVMMVQKMQRDKEEQKTIIVCHIGTS